MPILIRADEGVGLNHRGFGLFLVTVIMTVLSTVLVLFRLQQRYNTTQKPGKDDIAICVSMFFNYIFAIATIVGVVYGYGMHQSELGGYDRHIASIMFYLMQIFYKATLNSTKLSMLFMYLCIFTDNRALKATKILMCTIFVYAVESIIFTIVQCGPPDSAFDNPLGICFNVTIFWYANAIFNLVTDSVILALPMPMVHGLRMRNMHKLGLFFLFGLGIFVCGITISRMTLLEMPSKNPDVTYGSYGSTYWSIVEVNTGILCACLSTWRSFLGQLFPCIFPHSNHPRRAHGHWYGNNPTRAVSLGYHGASHVSQASSQIPLVALPPVIRSGSDTLQVVPYDQTVSAGEPSFNRLDDETTKAEDEQFDAFIRGLQEESD